jgi:hypothetical protein
MHTNQHELPKLPKLPKVPKIAKIEHRDGDISAFSNC